MRRNTASRSKQKLSPTPADMASEERQSGAGSRSGRRKTATYWYKKKLEAMSVRFNPVVFPPPEKHLDIASHEILLKRLGLWAFVNLDFGESIIREDLVKELVLCYKPDRKRSRVDGVSVALNRTTLGNVLRLPTKIDFKGFEFSISKDEALFLEELVWGFLVLADGDESASVRSHSYMLGFADALRERKLEAIDWAGLVWYMVEREVKKGKNLINCFYAPHLQLVLKNTKPEWFGDGFESGKTKTILSKCSKRKRKRVLLDEDDEEGKRSGKLDLAGRQILGDLDVVRQSENGGKLSLDLQVHSESYTHNPSESGVEISEPKGAHMKEYGIYEGKESVEGVMDLNSGGWKLSRCQKDNDVIEWGSTRAASEVGNVIDSLDEVHCMKEGDEMADKANEAECGTSTLDAAEVQSDKVEDRVCETDSVNCKADLTGKEVESIASVDLLMALEAHNELVKKDSSTDSIDQQEIENKQKRVDMIEEQYKPVHECNSATEMHADVSGQKLDLNCVEDNAVRKVEHMGSVDLVKARKAHDDVVKKEGTTDHDNALGVHCMEGDYLVPNKAIEAHHIGDPLIVPRKAPNEFVEDKENKTAFEANADNLLEVHCKTEDGGIGDEAKTICEANILISHELHSEKDDDLSEEEEKEAIFEAYIGKSVEVRCENKDDLLPFKEQGAVFEAYGGNSLGVCGFKEGTSADKVNISDSLEVSTVQDCRQSKLVFKHETEMNREPEFSSDAMECKEVYTGKELESVSADWLVAQEAHDKGVKKAGSSDGLDGQEMINRKKGVNIIDNQCQFTSETEMNGVSLAKVADVGMDCEDSDLYYRAENVGIKVEPGASVDFLAYQACEGKTSDLHGDREQRLHKKLVQIDLSSDSDDEERQNAFEDLERGKGSGKNGIGIAGVSLGQIAFETDTAGCSFGMTAQHGHVEKSRDLNHCAEKVQIWVERCVDSAKKQADESDYTSAILQKKVEEQTKRILKYQLMLQTEQQENQEHERMLQMVRQQKLEIEFKYERELDLTNSTLEHYRKSSKKINSSFAKYKKLSTLPQKQDEQKGSRLAIRAMLENIEQEWKSKLEKQLAMLEAYCDRLGELEHVVKTVKTLRGRL